MLRKDAPDAWLLSFATAGNEACERGLLDSATAIGGLKGVFPWRAAGLAEIEFLRRNQRLLTLCAKAGLGLWKPALIGEQLRAIPSGDLLIYHDVGKGFWGDFAFRLSVLPLLEWTVAANRGVLPGVWIPEDGRNARWTPTATFRLMRSDDGEYWNTPQVATVYSVWRHDDFALDLLAKWAEACAAVYSGDTGQRDRGAEEGVGPDFVADRGAQSILTNLLVREGVGSYGKPYESSAVQFHPIFSPVPASDIGGLVARVLRDRADAAPSAGSGAGIARPPSPHAGSRHALFTSIPPTLDRRSANGFEIGAEYQRECVQSWLDCGFEIYSVHFTEEIGQVRRLPRVNYVGMERTEDDRPGDRKPSLRAILKLVQEVGADLSGIANSDILLLNPPGWIETVEAEVPDSIIAFSRYEIGEDRTCVGAAPWGIDLFFIDRRFIAELKYCGMRIGETWWDYWLPLWCWFEGAEIKHVSDYVALHLDHPVVSNDKVQEYGLRFLQLLRAEAAGPQSDNLRLVDFERYCAYRIAAEKRRLGISNENSRQFVEKILNPTCWAGVQDLLRRNQLPVVEKLSPHHRVLARTIIGTARVAETARAQEASALASAERIPESYLRFIGVRRDDIERGASLVDHVNLMRRRWPYRLDLWVSNLLRRAVGKPAKMMLPAATSREAVEQIIRLRRHVLWRLFTPVDGFFQLLRWIVARRVRS